MMGWIRIRLGDNEIELEGTDEFIEARIEQFYARIEASASAPQRPASNEQSLEPSTPQTTPSTEPTPDEFYQQKGHRKDGVSTILVFGKYLEQYRAKREFTQSEIREAARDAKLAKPIHGQYFTIAVRQGLLRKQGQHYSLTFSGERFLADSLTGPLDVPTGIRLAIS